MLTYTKLRSGSWGIRSTSKIEAGQSVTVTKKSGETKLETIDRVIWTDGKVWLASISPAKSQSQSQSGPSASSKIERTYRRKYGWDGVRGSPSYYSSGMYDEDS